MGIHHFLVNQVVLLSLLKVLKPLLGFFKKGVQRVAGGCSSVLLRAPRIGWKMWIPGRY